MRHALHRLIPVACSTFLLIVIAATTAASLPLSPDPTSPGPPSDPVYGLAAGCYSLQSDATGRLVTFDGTTFAATTESAEAAEAFRLHAAQLGRFMFYGSGRLLLAEKGTGVSADPAPTKSADWTLTFTAGTYAIVSTHTGKQLGVDRRTGRLTLTGPGTDPAAGRFRLAAAQGCVEFPESAVGAEGIPATTPPGAEVRGFIDTHVHMNASEFIGGELHCGAPFDPQGITVALADCPDHGSTGLPAVLENILSHGNPIQKHDTTGWPTFTDFPAHDSLTHEQTYYRWVERAWRGGLRIFTNLLVSNRVLCEIYWHKSLPCNEMDTIRIQAQKTHELQDYIDAQYGGPGRGWFRIATSPAEVRQVASEGKLAVTLGIEISEPFGCRVVDGSPRCTEADIDRGLDEVYSLGVRQMNVTHKFDNALGGVRFDPSIQGVAVNVGNAISTGSFWRVEPCTGTATDNPVAPIVSGIGRMAQDLPGGITVPIYPPGPHCNVRGLTDLGRHMIEGMMDRGMIVDVDHMSVKTANDTLGILEKADYSGVVSSHSWTHTSNYSRIYRLGGFVASYASGAEAFVGEWQAARADRDSRFYFGYGYGADTNGFGPQAAPSASSETDPVTYPFTTFDGDTTMTRQQTGDRTFDVNVDGVAHYGLIPDWLESLRLAAGADGPALVDEMSRGAEAYLQMWERVAK